MNVTKLSPANYTGIKNQKNNIQNKNNIAFTSQLSTATEVVEDRASALGKSLLSELKFFKNIALKDGKLFTGVAEHVGKNGDKFALEYKAGEIVKASKNINPQTGDVDIAKGFFVKKYSKDGDKFYVHTEGFGPNGENLRGKLEIGWSEITRKNASHQESYTRFYDNGRPKEQKLFDGTTREWFYDGTKKSEFLSDGTIRKWNRFGKMYEASINLPKPVNVEYQENPVDRIYVRRRDKDEYHLGDAFLYNRTDNKADTEIMEGVYGRGMGDWYSYNRRLDLRSCDEETNNLLTKVCKDFGIM